MEGPSAAWASSQLRSPGMSPRVTSQHPPPQGGKGRSILAKSSLWERFCKCPMWGQRGRGQSPHSPLTLWGATSQQSEDQPWQEHWAIPAPFNLRLAARKKKKKERLMPGKRHQSGQGDRNTYANLLIPGDGPGFRATSAAEWYFFIKGAGGGGGSDKSLSSPPVTVFPGTPGQRVCSARGASSSPLPPPHFSNQRISSCALFTVDIFWLIGEE